MSAKIQVKYWGELITLTGKKDDEVEASSVAELIKQLEKTYGKAAAKEGKRMLIAVNGTNIQLLERCKTRLNEGDRVAFLPLSGGG